MEPNQNPLYPVFLKLHELDLLLVGAGKVAFEKLSFILKSSPEANITIVAPSISLEIKNFLSQRGIQNVQIEKKKFEPKDVEGHNLVIAATSDKALNQKVQKFAKAKGKLVNVVDTPSLCDFYMGSIVTKGNLKVAISTNGTSPTFAKRFRQVLEEILPDEVDGLLRNLDKIRKRLNGDFSYKVQQLNEITSELLRKN